MPAELTARESPSISVIMPVYNGGAFIGGSLPEPQHLIGKAAGAAASVAAAMSLAAEVGAGPSSDIGFALVRARKLIGP